MHVQAFLSCSFDPKDRDVVDFFASICRGLDLECVNVDKGYVLTPPEQARKLIMDSQALIAIGTCREELKSGFYSIPKAVEQEVSMAFGNNKKILIFLEDGVDTTSGFTDSYSTYFKFDRSSLLSPKFLQQAVASIHGLKMDVIMPEELQLEQLGQKNVFAESSRHKIELIDNSGLYTCRYSQTRRLKFLSRFIDPIKTAGWAEVQTKENSPSDFIKWSCHIEDSNRPFILNATEEKSASNICQLSITFDPTPEKEDFIEYSVTFESPYLNPVYMEDVEDDHPGIIVNGTKYRCVDGLIPTMRIQDLKIQFCIPASLGLKKQDIVPFVGSYALDYLVESETKRMAIEAETFAGNIFYELTIQSPLIHHFYGVAWNPPIKPIKR